MIDLRHHGDADLLPGMVDLAVNVRPGTPPQWLRERIAAAELAGYPDQSAALRAVAARHGRRSDEVLLTAGGAEAFVLLARALRPRHAVVVHPQFTEPEQALRSAGHPVHRLVLAPPYRLEPAAVAPEADLVVLGNPTNPTSVLHPATALRELARPGRLVVVDEAFADCDPDETQSLAARSSLDGFVVVRSLTKTWGLAGLRIGYVLAAPDVIDALRAAQPPWPVSAPALAAAEAVSEPGALVESRRWARELAAERHQLLLDLAEVAGVEVVPDPRASFVLLRTPRSDVRERLHRYGVAVRRGESFPGLDQHWVRVAVRDRATMTAFVAALQRVLEEGSA